MTIYAIGNDASMLSTGVLNQTAGKFNSAWTDRCIQIPDNTAGSIALPGQNLPGNELWIHFDAWVPAPVGVNSSNIHYIFRLICGDRAVAELQSRSSTSLGIRYISGGTSSVNEPNTTGISIPYPEGLHTFDIRYVANVGADPDSYTYEMYLNGALYYSVNNFHTYINGQKPSQFLFGGKDFASSADDYVYISQIIISDEDTRGMRFKDLPLTGQGNYNQWSSGYAVLADGDTTTMASSDAAGERTSATITPGSAPSTGPFSVVSSMTARRGLSNSNPGQVQQFLRIAGTDYSASTAFTPTFPLWERRFDVWALNPADSGQWEWADLTGMEVGLLSVT